MKRVMTLCVLVLTLTMALCPAALAADLGSAATAAQVCYPIGIWNNNRIFLPSGAVNAAPLFCVLSEKLPAAGRAQNSGTR